MNEKTWHEVSWESFVAEFTPSVEETYVVVTRSTFENVYVVNATSADEAVKVFDDHDMDFYQKHIGEPVIRVSKVPLDGDEIHDTLMNNGYF